MENKRPTEGSADGSTEGTTSAKRRGRPPRSSVGAKALPANAEKVARRKRRTKAEMELHRDSIEAQRTEAVRERVSALSPKDLQSALTLVKSKMQPIENASSKLRVLEDLARALGGNIGDVLLDIAADLKRIN